MSNTYKELFMEEIKRQQDIAKKAGKKFVNLTSRDIHQEVGGYPARNHKMPSCCEAMYALMKTGDEVVAAPPSGKGAYLTIKYNL